MMPSGPFDAGYGSLLGGGGGGGGGALPHSSIRRNCGSDPQNLLGIRSASTYFSGITMLWLERCQVRWVKLVAFCTHYCHLDPKAINFIEPEQRFSNLGDHPSTASASYLPPISPHNAPNVSTALGNNRLSFVVSTKTAAATAKRSRPALPTFLALNVSPFSFSLPCRKTG